MLSVRHATLPSISTNSCPPTFSPSTTVVTASQSRVAFQSHVPPGAVGGLEQSVYTCTSGLGGVLLRGEQRDADSPAGHLHTGGVAMAARATAPRNMALDAGLRVRLMAFSGRPARCPAENEQKRRRKLMQKRTTVEHLVANSLLQEGNIPNNPNLAVWFCARHGPTPFLAFGTPAPFRGTRAASRDHCTKLNE